MIAKNRRIKKKGSYRAVVFPVLIGILLFGIVSFLIVSNLRINKRRAELTSQIEVLKKEIQIFEEIKAQLQAGIAQTESDIYWEEKTREQGYQKPGEETVVVLPPEEEEMQ